MNACVAHLVAGAAGLVLAGAPAGASIVSFTGPVQQISPPAFVTMSTVYGSNPNDAVIWDEQQGVTISNLNMTLTANPGMSGLSPGGPVSGVVDSHYLYFWNGGGGGRITGTITYSGTIVGVAYDRLDLLASDAPLGPPGTIYDPSMLFIRGMGIGDWFSVNDDTLEYHLIASDLLNHVQFRVITAVPAPGSLALLGAGACVAARRRRR